MHVRLLRYILETEPGLVTHLHNGGYVIMMITLRPWIGWYVGISHFPSTNRMFDTTDNGYERDDRLCIFGLSILD